MIAAKQKTKSADIFRKMQRVLDNAIHTESFPQKDVLTRNVPTGITTKNTIRFVCACA
jgi:hypothetical protein